MAAAIVPLSGAAALGNSGLSLVSSPSGHVVGSLTAAPTPAVSNLGGFAINLVPDAGLSANAPALAAFNRAANAWASRISDPITVTINANLDVLSSGIIGATDSVVLAGGYDTIRNALVGDAAGNSSKSIVASLPTSAQFTATLPAGRSLSGNLDITKANAKAIGFTGLDATFGASDASITFSSAFTFDYDRSDGITPGFIDFETAAEHEIGHALGFISAVDDIDQSTVATYPSVSPDVLDLYRFARSSNNPSTTAQFTNFARDLTPGSEDVLDDLINEYRMSSGTAGGDLHQASHWKDDQLTGQYVGIMDPTLSPGTFEVATDADFRAMALLGYDVALPEPTCIGLLGAAGLLLARRRR